MTRTISRWFTASVAVVALLAISSTANAAALQFATFSQTTGNPVQFTNQGGFATLVATGQTKFNFTAATGLSTADRDANFTISSVITANAASFGGFAIQPVNNTSVLEIRDAVTNANLLTMIFTGTISGQLSSANASLAGDNQVASPNTVIYSSDLLTFTGTPASYLIGLPTVTPPFGITGNFLSSFTSNAQGSFSGTFNAVPAPTSMAMFGTGIVATLALAKRRNRKSLAAVKNV